jgi:hypothetical protein
MANSCEFRELSGALHIPILYADDRKEFLRQFLLFGHRESTYGSSVVAA